MTVKEFLISKLTERGMLESQAEQVFAQALPRLASDHYKPSWASPKDTYPTAMYTVWLVILTDEALKWIDTNCPKAWFRPMFMPIPEAEIVRLISSQDELN